MQERYYALYQLARNLATAHNEAQVLLQVLQDAAKMVEAKHGLLVIFNDMQQVETALALPTVPFSPEYREVLEILCGLGLIGFVYHAERTITAANIKADSRWPALPQAPFLLPTGSALGVTIKVNNQAIGVLLLMHPTIGYFTQEHVSTLEEVAALAGDVIHEHRQRAAEPNSITYRERFEHAVVPIILTDLAGKILGANLEARQLLGTALKDLVALSIEEIHKIAPAGITLEELAQSPPNEETSFRTMLTHPQRDDVPLMVRVRRLDYGKKDVLEWIQQDVTAQVQLEQLRQDLTAMVYHDLRGPLQTIKGSIHKLAEVLANHQNPAVLTMLQVGIRSTRQLRRMIDSLLDIQRLESGQKMLNLSQTELRVLLADATQLVQPLAIEAEQHLKFDWESDLPMVEVDSDMIVRVIINLMENAIKYTPEGETITLGAHRMGDGAVRVSITDSGPGIPANMLDQIFDKFSRVKYQDAPKGVGLGLAFCRLAVMAHEGRIWVESVEGEGSTFSFTLPLTPQNAVVDTTDLESISA